MEENRLQHRVAYQPSGLVMREEEGIEPSITGVAIVSEAEIILYEGPDYREMEVIDPSCISKEFIDTQDIKLNLLHERELSFARCNKGAGSLILDTREDGLHFEVPVPDCDLGKRARALIGNGTYTGCSFEFWPKDYEVTEREGADGKKEYLIRHTAFARIGAITIGMDPAYSQTSVNAREMYREKHEHDLNRAEEELLQKQREEQEAQHQMAREAEARKRWREREGALISLNER